MNIVAVIDIGSAHIIAALAEISPKGEISPLALVEIPSKGVKKGSIANIGLVQHELKVIMNELELEVGGQFQIHSIIPSISGASITGHNVTGSISVRGAQINENIVRDAIIEAKDSVDLNNHKILHILRQNFTLDRVPDIEDPFGLYGERLTAHAHLVAVAKTAYYNLLQSFTEAAVEVDHVIACGLAATLATTSPEERELGVCVLDIGAGTTDITIMQHGIIKYSNVIPLGGNLVTNDIAFFIRGTMESAEATKKQLDIHTPYPVSEQVEIPTLGEFSHFFSANEVANVARLRCEQIIDVALESINNAEATSLFPAGFILCGGGANLLGLEKLFSEKTNLFVRTASIEVKLPKQTLTGSRFATLMGLFLRAYEEETTRTMTNEEKTGIIGRLSKLSAELSQQLRKHF